MRHVAAVGTPNSVAACVSAIEIVESAETIYIGCCTSNHLVARIQPAGGPWIEMAFTYTRFICKYMYLNEIRYNIYI